MSLKRLIENQTIEIDDHKWGNREVKSWDNKEIDVHIDKKTHYKILGKKQKVRIKIPINSDTPITVLDAREKGIEIPRRLDREIKQAFENKKIRDAFMADLMNILRDYNTILNSEDRVRSILERLSRHFDLEWTGEKTVEYMKDILNIYTEIYEDKER